MTQDQAHTIINNLALGQDPIHGGQLANESIVQDVEVTRALFMAAQALAIPSKPIKAQRAQPANAGKTWTKEDDQQLCADFAAGMEMGELTSKYQRSRWGIHSRLLLLGKIAPSLNSAGE